MTILPAPQHFAPAPCPSASSLEMVEGWRKRLADIQEEIDRETYDFGKVDLYHLEDASNKIKPVLVALRKEMNRIQEG